ncbi:MAG: methyltransferase domain-containing protein [Pseudomonadota bacterium]
MSQDEQGYFNTQDLISLPDGPLLQITKECEHNRYNEKGWRNHKNLWRSSMMLDDTHDKTIIDYGCGFGMESLQLAKTGNRMILCDILQSNIALAKRILELHGFSPLDTVHATIDSPFFTTRHPIDIFYSNGVMHHTPYFREILTQATRMMHAKSEIRLWLYSDIRWQSVSGDSQCDPHMDITQHPCFAKFVYVQDGAGVYADWYNLERFLYRVGDLFKVTFCQYISDGIGFVIHARPKPLSLLGELL